jgi:hypothetical protein
LVTAALDGLDDPRVPLSTIVRKAIRIARLRRDYKNLLWLKLDRVYELSCKGTHADVSEFESTQCVMEAYLVAGHVLEVDKTRVNNPKCKAS